LGAAAYFLVGFVVFSSLAAVIDYSLPMSPIGIALEVVFQRMFTN